MTFAALWTLLLTPLWLVLLVRFVRRQRRALDWIDENVGPRFRRRLTAWTRSSSRRHLALLATLAGALTLASTGPGWLTGEAKTQDAGRLLVAVDGSASMLADDVEARGREEPMKRFEAARETAAALAEALDDWEIGLASWSGVATVHLPLQRDAALTADAARGLRNHYLYRSSGSSFETILDLALRFHDPEENALQVLLLTDGEMPQPESYDEALAALAEAGVVVHAVGLGGAQPYSMVIYEPPDLSRPDAEREVMKSFQTSRVDEHLARIARLTGGHYVVPDLASFEGDGPVFDDVATQLADRLRSVEVDAGAEQRQRAKRDLTAWLLALVLVGVVLDLHVLARGRGGDPTFRLDAIGRPPGKKSASSAVALVALVALLPLSCGEGGLADLFGGSVWKAHRANEEGIQRDQIGRHDAAETSFLRSVAFDVEPETPTYNHARSRARAEDFARAHELNESALELSPALHEARFNDGLVLYRWGAAEAHPQGCELERTLDLWQSALRRFDQVAASARDDALRRRAAEQAEVIRREAAYLQQLVDEPPAPCRPSESESPEDSPDEDQNEPPPSAPPPSQPPPSQPPPSQPPPSQTPPSQPPPAQTPPSQPPPTGPSNPPPPSPGSNESPGGSGGGGLSDAELEQIRGELERIRAEAREDGKYHFRSAPEQMDEESWGDPDEVWW